jgi:hypothetical protein
MTSNQGTQKVFSFNRAELLAGTPGARSIYVNFNPPNAGFFAPLPGDAADGTLPPTGTPCPIFSYSDNGWGTGYSDAVNIYQMSVNWVPTTPTASITLSGILPTAAFDGSYDANWDDCPQPNTTQKLDGIGGVCMYRAQFKSWTGYNTVVLNWGVKSSSTQRSIKWCELRQNQTTNTWSIYQEGIYRPDTTATRWMGSIAMDNNGSIGLSYLKSNSTSIYPGIYYTGRRSCDPLGTLPVIETIVIAGTGSQTGTNRVGDYSHTQEAWSKAKKYITANGFKENFAGNYSEVYVKTIDDIKQPSKWITEIYIPVFPKAEIAQSAVETVPSDNIPTETP